MKRLSPLVLALAASLLLASPAAAETKTETYTVGPITVGPYQVKQAIDFGIPKPAEDASITAMDVDVVDAPGGQQVPIDRLMLHHVVFANLGRTLGERRDGTCSTFTSLDSISTLPAVGERFYAAGEERARLTLPPGYAYQSHGADTWLLTWMLMNHRAETDTAYIEYHVTYDTEPRTAVKPYWLDVKNCLSDPVFDAPGGGKPGSTYRRSTTWTVPQAGRIVAGGGHVHGGAKNLVLQRAACGREGHVYTSRPLWGNPDHPFYNVRPILHEPGPVNMSGFLSPEGFPVSGGEKLRLDANYDGELPHTRVMGIMLVYLVPDESASGGCKPPPADLAEYASSAPGRIEPTSLQGAADRHRARRRGPHDPQAAREAQAGGERHGHRGRQRVLLDAERDPQGRRLAELGLRGIRAPQRDRCQRPARLLVGQPEREPRLPQAAAGARDLQALLRPAPRVDDFDGQGRAEAEAAQQIRDAEVGA